MVQSRVAAAPAPDGGRRRGKAAVADRDGRVGIACVIVCDADGPAGRRRLARNGDVAAERDENAGAAELGREPGAAVGGERLRGGAEIELDTRRESDRAGPRIDADDPPPGHAFEPGTERVRVALGDDAERRVVPGEAERPADGRVDEAFGRVSRGQCGLDRGEEQGGRRDFAAVGAHGPRELAVLAKAAARTVDGRELGRDECDRVVARGRIHHGDGRGRSERAEGTGHEPPETTAGAAGVGAGADADGAGAGVGDGCGTADPTATSGGAVWRAGDVLTVRRGAVRETACEPALRPGNAFAASPPSASASTPAPAMAPLVMRLSRRCPTSRAQTRCMSTRRVNPGRMKEP